MINGIIGITSELSGDCSLQLILIKHYHRRERTPVRSVFFCWQNIHNKITELSEMINGIIGITSEQSGDCSLQL